MNTFWTFILVLVFLFEDSNSVLLKPLYRYYHPSYTNHITQATGTWQSPGFNYPGTFLGYGFNENIPGTVAIYRYYSSTHVDHITSRSDPGPDFSGEAFLAYIATGPTSVADDTLRQLGCELTLAPLNRYFVASTVDHFDQVNDYGGTYNDKTTLGYVCIPNNSPCDFDTCLQLCIDCTSHCDSNVVAGARNIAKEICKNNCAAGNCLSESGGTGEVCVPNAASNTCCVPSDTFDTLLCP